MSKSENNHDNSDLQMLKEEVSEKEYQNAQYEAEKKKHISYWLHTAVASGHGCGAQRPLCGLTATPI